MKASIHHIMLLFLTLLTAAGVAGAGQQHIDKNLDSEPSPGFSKYVPDQRLPKSINPYYMTSTEQSRQVMNVLLAAREEEVATEGPAAVSGSPTGLPAGFERRSFRSEFDNDVLLGSDNQFSNGWSLQYHGSIGRTWDEVQYTPGFVRTFGSKIPTLTAPGLYYRAGVALGQVIQTPDDIENPNLIVDDVPYAGALCLQASWYAFNDDKFRGFEITAGSIGSPLPS